jgi:thiamine biosynthesis lipoprotein
MIVAISGCQNGLREFQQRRILLGTRVSVTLLAENEETANRAMDAAFSEISAVDSLMSLYRQTSELTKLNRLGFSRNRELIEVIRECRKWGESTDGAFDVTGAPLFRLWDFKRRRIPEADDLSAALERLDYRKIEVNDSVVQIGDGAEIDLGGAAKGYAVDRAIVRLKKCGIKHALVDAGGDIRVMGGRGKEPWKIGVKHPRRDGTVRLVELWDGGITTSGDYERYFVSGGVRYHHILDPRTGYPAVGCVSVTILAENAMEADILSTGVFVLGRDLGIALLEDSTDLGALIITEHGGNLIMDEVGRLGNERGQILHD